MTIEKGSRIIGIDAKGAAYDRLAMGEKEREGQELMPTSTEGLASGRPSEYLLDSLGGRPR